MRNRVLGVDACKTGWIGVALEGPEVSAYFAETIEELVARAAAPGPLAVVAVDMPIGLPDRGIRQADLLARRAVGRLRSSVFLTPVRDALDAPDHCAATAVNLARAGVGISLQAFSLKPRLLQVQEWVRRTHHRVVEAHPEVSFVQLAGAPLNVSKKTWAGAARRARLLACSPASTSQLISARPASRRSTTFSTQPCVPGPQAGSPGARPGPVPDSPRCSATACPARSGADRYPRY